MSSRSRRNAKLRRIKELCKPVTPEGYLAGMDLQGDDDPVGQFIQEWERDFGPMVRPHEEAEGEAAFLQANGKKNNPRQ